jgi:hypothetical protein
MKRFVAIPGLILMTVASGCFYELRDEMAEHQILWSNKFAAYAAWQNSQSTCQGISCPHSFKEGFVAGYIDVANGGTGCAPAIPEIPCCNHMWMDRCSESQKMEAWYDGYEIGVIAARSDGMTDVNRITTRIPRPLPMDLSNLNQVPASDQKSSGTVPTPAVPPVPSPIPPSPQPNYSDGPQTFYSPDANQSGSSTMTPNSF